MKPETDLHDLAALIQAKTTFEWPLWLSGSPQTAAHIPFFMWAVETWAPSRLVEIGTTCGNSYCAFLQASRAASIPLDVTCVSGASSDAGEDPPAAAQRDLWAYVDQEYPGQAQHLHVPLEGAPDQFPDGSIDLLHIASQDACREACRSWTAWLGKLTSRGVVLLHGITQEGESAATALWAELSAQYPSFSFTHGGGLGIAYVGSEVAPASLTWLIGAVGPHPVRTEAVRRFFARLGRGVAEKVKASEDAKRAKQARAEQIQALGTLAARCDELAALAATNEAQIAALRAEIAERDRRLSILCHRPGLRFDANWYLEAYPDVRDAGFDALTHYIAFGEAEGRLPWPPDPNAAVGGTQDAGQGGAPGADGPVPADPYDTWMAANILTETDIAALRSALSEREGRLPKISVVTPIYDTAPDLFEEMIQSVRSQIYEDWELCLADDGSSSPHVGPMLDAAAASDPRIRVVRLPTNGGISAATNAGVHMARGEIIAFLDHDDIITPDCLAELAIYYADHPQADMVYSDDDKIDMVGRRYAPQFKPDWSPVLLLSYMYMAHIFTVRRSLFLELEGFRPPFDGAQDFDFALRAAERARHVGHVPKVLYHWRSAPGSTATSADAKPASFEAGRRAVEEALARRGVHEAKALHPEWAALGRCGIFDVEFPDTGPSVTIVIPTRDKVELLRSCVESLDLTTYRDFDILIIDNDSTDPEALAYLDELRGRKNVRVETVSNADGKFNYAKINNQAILNHCSSTFVLLLNNDTRVVSPRWLSQMVGYAGMPNVGAVGARLYFEDGTLQHAGVVHGYHDGLPGHAFRNIPAHEWGYMGFARASREYSAVTAACMLTPRDLFVELGGFDDVHFAVAYNDVDYCYRIVQSGRTCVYCATAELFHFEGKTRGYKDDPQEQLNFSRLYGTWHDRWYNPNLSLANERFEPASTRTIRPPRTGQERAQLAEVEP